MDQIIKPYQGKKKYVFISYAHKDSTQVLPVIAKLQSEGYRVWYDEGIPSGTEWDVYISRSVKSCGYMIAFVSKNYFNSKNCKDELNLASDKDKPVLLVYLESVELPEGIDLRFGRSQYISKYRYKRDSDFYDKLFETKGISVCRDKIKPESKFAPTSVTKVTKKRSPNLFKRLITKKLFTGISENKKSKRHDTGKFSYTNGITTKSDTYGTVTKRDNNGIVTKYDNNGIVTKYDAQGKIISRYRNYENNKKMKPHNTGKFSYTNGVTVKCDDDGTVTKYDAQGKIISRYRK